MQSRSNVNEEFKTCAPTSLLQLKSFADLTESHPINCPSILRL